MPSVTTVLARSIGWAVIGLGLACDRSVEEKLPAPSAPPVQPVDEELPTPPVVEPPAPPAAPPTPVSPPTPTPPAAPAAAPVSFATQVATLLDERGITVGAEPMAAAWKHYKAKRYDQAVALFGAAALKPDAGYKPAFNMACAAALGGDEHWAELALTEALDRDRPRVTAKIETDADLESIRDALWLTALLGTHPDGGDPPEDPSELDLDAEELADPRTKFEMSWYGVNCQDLDARNSLKRCWDEYLVGEYSFTKLDFIHELPLPELPDPGSMPKSRWRRVKAKLDYKAIASAIGARGVFGLDPDRCKSPRRLPPNIYGDECPFYRPGYWWAADDQVFLVIPHTERRSPVTAKTVTIARKIDGQWKGATIDSIKDGHRSAGAWNLFSGVLLRGDGGELWTWAEGGIDGGDDDEQDIDPYLCRIRWHEGSLQRACRTDWEHRLMGVYD